MPIDVDEFEQRDGDELAFGEGTQADRLLTYLAERDDRAFTQGELHEATGIKRGSVGAVLSRLEEKGLVRHKGRYWAVTAEVTAARGDDAIDAAMLVKLL